MKVQRMLNAGLLAFCISYALYDTTHRPNMPELLRYIVGGLTILVVDYVLYRDDQRFGESFVSMGIAALGVGANRLRMELEHE